MKRLFYLLTLLLLLPALVIAWPVNWGEVIMQNDLTINGTIIVGRTASPTIAFGDSDTTDDDDNVQVVVACTDTGAGTEDCDVTWGQQVAGSMTTYQNVDADGSLTFSKDTIFDGTTPLVTIGDAGAEDAQITFDGNVEDFYIALYDTDDDLVIGLGATAGTTPAITISDAGASTITTAFGGTVTALEMGSGNSLGWNSGTTKITATTSADLQLSSGTNIAYLIKDSSGTPQDGLATGLQFFGYAISLTDDAEADSCTLGGSGTADCFILPVATSSGRLVVYSATAYGEYTVSSVGVATSRGAAETNTAYVAAIADCDNDVICLFDDATTANALGIINQLGSTQTVQVQFWYD